MYLPQWSPYAFFLFGYGVRWYSLFMAVSMVLGTWYLVRQGKKQGLSPDALMDVAVWALVGGIAGARAVFVLANDPAWIVHDPLQILRIYQGGLSWHGGVLGGLAGTWLALRRRDDVPFRTFLDLSVPGLSVGYILVRVGNIFNHEVLGRMTQLGFGRWPAQPIGSAIGLFLLVRYVWLARRSPPPGVQFWSFVLWYQVLRGCIEETVRQNPLYLIHWVDPVWGIGFTTLTQLFTPPIVALAWVMTRRCLRTAPPPLAQQAPAAPDPVSTP